jgi:exodeoxyribonuclease VII large subunit
MTDNGERIWQVSELNHAARAMLERQFGLITVCGELSGLTKARSGHWYFTLKDIEGQVRCAMFRNRNLYCQFQPQEGDLVHLQAKVSIYPGRGDYQLIGERMTPAGAGQLQAAFQELKTRLEKDGLFAPERKRAVPEHCQRIAVITSADGAAVHDIISVAGKRMPSLQIDVLPVAVQGPSAAPSTCQAIELCNMMGMHDAIIVARGGGSMEDLWSFNDENLARYIANSAIPVISAVGHETDFTICDFVADVRAPTPSAAAEIVSQDQSHLSQRTKQLDVRLHQSIQTRLRHQGLVLQQLASQLRKPDQQLQDYSQRLDKLSSSMEQSLRSKILRLQTHAERLGSRIQAQSPLTKIALNKQKLANLSDRSTQSAGIHQKHYKDNLAHLAGMLHQLSPLQTLSRGYSITQDLQGKVITNATEVESGQALRLRLGEGELGVTAD